MHRSLTLLFALWIFSFNAQAASEYFTVKVISESAPMYSKPDPSSEIIGYLKKGDLKLITSYFKVRWPKIYLKSGIPAYLDISDLKIMSDAFSGHRADQASEDKNTCKPSPSDTEVRFRQTNFRCNEGNRGYSSCSVSLGVTSRSSCATLGTSIITCKTRVGYEQNTSYGKDSFISENERIFPLIMMDGYAEATFKLGHNFGSMGYTTSAKTKDVQCKLNLVID